MTDKLTIGEIVGVHGVRGELKVKPLTDEPEQISELQTIEITQKGKAAPYTPLAVRMHKGMVLLTLKEVTDRNAAEALRGAFLTISRDQAQAPGEDEYYITDFIGMNVVSNAGEAVGRVTDVLQTTGSVDTVEINTGVKKIYVPARKIYFTGVSHKERLITANIPQEYFEL